MSRAETALVTGGAGFIGSHLVDALLHRGIRVRVLDDLSTGRRENLAHCRTDIEFLEGDIRDADGVRTACRDVAVVYHQAALGSVPRSMKDPAKTLAINVGGTANVFAAARDAGVRRVVYASSSSVYGDSERLPRREGHEGRSLSPYAASKRIGEEMADVFGRCFGMEIVGLRYFNVYGPRQDPDGPYAAVIPRFFKACLSGEAPVVYGDGAQTRDFTFVQDAVAANLLAGTAEGAAGLAINVATGRRTSVLELARLVGEAAGGSRPPAREDARAGDIAHSVADLDLAHRALGYEPTVPLETGLRESRAHYERALGAVAGRRG